MPVPEKSTPELIADLQSERKELVRYAIHNLGERRADEAIPALVDLLTARIAEYNYGSAEALKQIGKPVIHAVMPILHNQMYVARGLAAQILGEVGAIEAIPEIIPLLDEPDSAVVWRAIEALGKLHHPLIERFSGFLSNSNERIRAAAAEALYEVGFVDTSAWEILRDKVDFLDRHVGVAAIKATGKLGGIESTKALHNFLKHLADRYYDIYGLASQAFEATLTLNSVDFLIENLNPERYFLGFDRLLLRFLSYTYVPRAKLYIEQYLLLCAVFITDPDVDYRAAALSGWVAHDPETAMPAVGRALIDDEEKVRLGAINALAHGTAMSGQIISYEDVNAVLFMLMDAKPYLRKMAVEVLARLTDPAHIPALLTSLYDQNVEVAHAAATALLNFQGTTLIPDLIQYVVTQPNAESIIAGMLKAYPQEDIWLPLLKIRTNGYNSALAPSTVAHYFYQEFGDSLIEPFIAFLEDNDAAVRLNAIMLFDLYNVAKDKPIYSRLQERVKKEPDSEIRIYALKALSVEKRVPLIPVLITWLRSADLDLRDTALENLATLWEHSGLLLIKRLAQAAEPERWLINQILARTGGFFNAYIQQKLAEGKAAYLHETLNTVRIRFYEYHQPWRYVNYCRYSPEIQSQLIADTIPATDKACPRCNSSELTHFYFTTPHRIWTIMRGRAGIMWVCDACGIQVDFQITEMN